MAAPRGYERCGAAEKVVGTSSMARSVPGRFNGREGVGDGAVGDEYAQIVVGNFLPRGVRPGPDHPCGQMRDNGSIAWSEVHDRACVL